MKDYEEEGSGSYAARNAPSLLCRSESGRFYQSAPKLPVIIRRVKQGGVKRLQQLPVQSSKRGRPARGDPSRRRMSNRTIAPLKSSPLNGVAEPTLKKGCAAPYVSREYFLATELTDSAMHLVVHFAMNLPEQLRPSRATFSGGNLELNYESSPKGAANKLRPPGAPLRRALSAVCEALIVFSDRLSDPASGGLAAAGDWELPMPNFVLFLRDVRPEFRARFTQWWKDAVGLATGCPACPASQPAPSPERQAETYLRPRTPARGTIPVIPLLARAQAQFMHDLAAAERCFSPACEHPTVVATHRYGAETLPNRSPLRDVRSGKPQPLHPSFQGVDHHRMQASYFSARDVLCDVADRDAIVQWVALLISSLGRFMAVNYTVAADGEAAIRLKLLHPSLPLQPEIFLALRHLVYVLVAGWSAFVGPEWTFCPWASAAEPLLRSQLLLSRLNPSQLVGFRAAWIATVARLRQLYLQPRREPQSPPAPAENAARGARAFDFAALRCDEHTWKDSGLSHANFAAAAAATGFGDTPRNGNKVNSKGLGSGNGSSETAAQAASPLLHAGEVHCAGTGGGDTAARLASLPPTLQSGFNAIYPPGNSAVRTPIWCTDDRAVDGAGNFARADIVNEPPQKRLEEKDCSEMRGHVEEDVWSENQDWSKKNIYNSNREDCIEEHKRASVALLS